LVDLLHDRSLACQVARLTGIASRQAEWAAELRCTADKYSTPRSQAIKANRERLRDERT
jgi:hypothetical protein